MRNFELSFRKLTPEEISAYAATKAIAPKSERDLTEEKHELWRTLHYQATGNILEDEAADELYAYCYEGGDPALF